LFGAITDQSHISLERAEMNRLALPKSPRTASPCETHVASFTGEAVDRGARPEASGAFGRAHKPL